MEEALNEDVQHVDMFLRLGDIYVAFGTLFQCFAQMLSFLFHCFPPFQLFEISLVFFTQP